MKKIILIALIFFLAAIGIASYFIFGKSPVNNLVGNTNENGSPFGTESPNANLGGNSRNTTGTGQPTSGPVSTLNRIYGDPVSGATIIPASTGNIVRLTERATGHIYDFPLATGVIQKISNTTIPKVYESLWLSGSTTIFRYLNDAGTAIQTYSVKLVVPKTSSTSPALLTIQGSFLPENIESIAANPAGTKLFYLTRSSTGSQGTVANADGTGKGAIFSSSISEWVAGWPSSSIITLTTKPSAGVAGYLYFLDPKGAMKKVMGDVSGLTTVTNSQGSFVAFSDSLNSLQIYNVKTGFTDPISVRTIADKCIWSKKQSTIIFCAVPTQLPPGSYPDAWYQGKVSFSDEIYRIDTTLHSSTKIGPLKTGYNQDIDAISLALSPAEDYLTFINKKDLSLWGLRLPVSTSTPTH